MRGAGRLLMLLALAAAGPVTAQDGFGCAPEIRSAAYAEPTTRYPHGALGDKEEWGVLTVDLARPDGCEPSQARLGFRLPPDMVFEDVAPRLVDLDGRGGPELIVVESHLNRGARLAVWGVAGDQVVRLAATPFIGKRFRWLAPAGAADLDGDGMVEIAYVDRPHLDKVLRVWRYEPGRLREVASLDGLTNHQLGETAISGGIRNCGKVPEVITASGDWRQIMATTLSGGKLESTPLGPNRGPASFAAALACKAP